MTAQRLLGPVHGHALRHEPERRRGAQDQVAAELAGRHRLEHVERLAEVHATLLDRADLVAQAGGAELRSRIPAGFFQFLQDLRRTWLSGNSSVENVPAMFYATEVCRSGWPVHNCNALLINSWPSFSKLENRLKSWLRIFYHCFEIGL